MKKHYTPITDTATSNALHYDYDKECYTSGDRQICYPVSEKKKKEMRKRKEKFDLSWENLTREIELPPYEEWR